MKEELSEKVVEVRRVSDRVMTHVVVFEEDILGWFVGMLHKVEEVWRKNSLFMMS